MAAPETITIERGSILVYRMFDVADDVDLVMLEERARAAAGTSRLRIARPGGEALIIRNAPVSIYLGDHEVIVGGTAYRCAVQARVWDYGVVSLQFQLPVASMTWEKLVETAAAIEGSAAFEEAARRRLPDLLRFAGAAMRGAHEWPGGEDYVIYFLEELSGIANPALLLERADIAALLLGEAAYPLSERARRAVTENWHQYWANDLAVIDWNSALVVEPGGSRDLPDVMEFALTHMVEFRYYDDLLDEKLASLYRGMSQSQRALFRTNYAQLSREASALFVELTEFIERVENSLKVIGDFYLATIFRTSVSRLRLQEWEESVTRKLQLLARVSEILSSQAAVHRSHLLEWIVILLIAFEIVWALAGH